MRAFLLSFTVFLSPALVHAQGNPADFNRPGPVKEREMYYAQVRTEVNELLIRWREAWENDDPGALARLYLEHASYYPLNTAAAQSRASAYSSLIPASRITLLHFARSSRTNRANSSGVLSSVSAPKRAKLSRVVRVRSTFTNAP